MHQEDSMFIRFVCIVFAILFTPLLIIASSPAAAAQAANNAAADQKRMAAEVVRIPDDVCKAIEAGDSDAVIAWLQKNPEAHKNARGPENRPLLTMLIIGKKSLQNAIDVLFGYNPNVWLIGNEKKAALFFAVSKDKNGQFVRNLVRRMHDVMVELCPDQSLHLVPKYISQVLEGHLVCSRATGSVAYTEALSEIELISQSYAQQQRIVSAKAMKELASFLPENTSVNIIDLVQEYFFDDEHQQCVPGNTQAWEHFTNGEKPEAAIKWLRQDPENNKNAQYQLGYMRTSMLEQLLSLAGKCYRKGYTAIDVLLDLKPKIVLRRCIQVRTARNVPIKLPGFFSKVHTISSNNQISVDNRKLIIKKIILLLLEQGNDLQSIKYAVQNDLVRWNGCVVSEVMLDVEQEVPRVLALAQILPPFLPKELVQTAQDYVLLLPHKKVAQQK
jgi:hypothetical protein